MRRKTVFGKREDCRGKTIDYRLFMKRPSIIVPEDLEGKVLLHACCAPCSSAIVEWLVQHEIRPVIFYYNPNIFPREEYEIRKNESKRHAES